MLLSKCSIDRAVNILILIVACSLSTTMIVSATSSNPNNSLTDNQVNDPIIDTVAGIGRAGFSGDNGPALAARLAFPAAVAVDRNGNIFIADAENNRIRRVNITNGNITTIAGTGEEGFRGDGSAAINAAISFPIGVTIDQAGNRSSW
jgi:hypothetical protein